MPNSHIEEFLQGEVIPLGERRSVKILWNGKAYTAYMNHLNRSKAKPVYHLRWDGNKDLLTALKKEFIQSYIAIESQKYGNQKNKKYVLTNLTGGNQEVIIITPVDASTIEFETFLKVETPYDNLFKRLVDENVFGWLSDPGTDYLITKSTNWMDIQQLENT